MYKYRFRLEKSIQKKQLIQPSSSALDVTGILTESKFCASVFERHRGRPSNVFAGAASAVGAGCCVFAGAGAGAAGANLAPLLLLELPAFEKLGLTASACAGW